MKFKRVLNMGPIKERTPTSRNHKLAMILLTAFFFVTGSTVTANENINADYNERNWRAFNIETVENYIIPLYKNFAVANNKLNKDAQNFCNVITSQNNDAVAVSFNKVKEAFHLSMDSWQFIQNIYFGPVEIGMRHHSIQFWPDKKNHIGKQLNKLIHGKNKSLLGVDAFDKNSVSVKGLPALERLLFSKGSLEAFKKEPFTCQVLVGISLYLSNTAMALYDEWLTSMLPQFQDAKQLDGYFEDDIDAATSLLKALVEPIEIIRDLKIERPLGSALASAKFKRLESWRSERSLRNLSINIQSLESFFEGNYGQTTGLRELLSDVEVRRIQQNFKSVISGVSSINGSLESAIMTPDGYLHVKKISQSLALLHTNLERAISHSGIRLGFNSRDGD